MSQLHPNAVYHLKHLSAAVTILTTDEGDIRKRLAKAGQELLMIPEEVMPSNLRKEYNEIRKYLTKYKGVPGASWPNNSDVQMTMKRRRSTTASETAKKIWSLYHKYLHELQRHGFP